jgi:hypothetical protein
MKAYPCLIFDANIVISLFAHGLWTSVVERCELILAETVVDEADFYVDAAGIERRINLKPDIDAARIRVVSVPIRDIASFRRTFDPVYVQKLDDGETESLVYCLQEGEPNRVCSSDAIVFKVLSVLDRSEQGVSLEEVLHSIGLWRPLSPTVQQGLSRGEPRPWSSRSVSGNRPQASVAGACPPTPTADFTRRGASSPSRSSRTLACHCQLAGLSGAALRRPGSVASRSPSNRRPWGSMASWQGRGHGRGTTWTSSGGPT